MSSLVQYIVVRGDLQWPVGALIAQGCHASVACIIKYLKEDTETQQYVQNLENMTKVVLKAESEAQMMQLCRDLDSNQIKYFLWCEKPENIHSCIATVPRSRNLLKPIFRQLKLFN